MRPPHPSATPRDPMVALLVVLSFTTGLVDAVSILGLSWVFTANMTGNIVFLAFALAGAPGFKWQLYLAALIFFALGAGVAGRLGRGDHASGRRRWLLGIAGVEAAMLLAAALCSIGYDPAAARPGWALLTMIGLTAAAMGMRNATVRHLKVADLTTTVLTLTVTGLAADSRLAGGDSANFGRRAASVLSIFAGALVGALLLAWGGLALPLVVAAVAIVASTVVLVRDPAPEGAA